MSAPPPNYWSDQGIEYLRSRTQTLKNWAESANDPHVRKVAITLEAYDPQAFRGRPADNKRRAELLIEFLNGIRNASHSPMILGPINQLISYFQRVRERPDVPGEAPGAAAAAPPPSPFDYVPSPPQRPREPLPEWWTHEGRIFVNNQHEDLYNYYEEYKKHAREAWAWKVVPRLIQIWDAIGRFKDAMTDETTAEHRRILAGQILVLLNGDWRSHLPQDPGLNQMLEWQREFFQHVQQHAARPRAERAPVPAWHGQGSAWQSDTWVYSLTKDLEQAIRKGCPMNERSVAIRLTNAVRLIRTEYLYREQSRSSTNPAHRAHAAESIVNALTSARNELAHSHHFRDLRPVVLDLLAFFQQVQASPIHPRQ